jgi:hypothetical protein
LHIPDIAEEIGLNRFLTKLNLVVLLSKTQPHPGHEKHLCKMLEDKVPMEKIKPLVKNAKYICKGCMRTAAKAENLCAPEPL